MKKILLLITLAGVFLSSCKKLATADMPPNQLTEDKVFSDTTSVNAAIAGLYIQLATVDANLVRNIGLYTDELKTTAVSASNTEFSNSSLTVTNASVLSIWQNLYSTIYKANEMISALNQPTSISIQAKKTALGESRFIRGYCYFYLTRLFGDVPLVLTTNTQVNAKLAKTSSSIVLQHVITDFDASKNLLTTDYPLGNGKTIANNYTALAYLSEACLEAGQYARADSAASAVINSGKYSLLADLTKVWTENNDEAILQLWNQNGFSPLNLITLSGIPANQITSSLFAAFTINDNRKAAWMGNIVASGTTYYFPYKYRQRTVTSGSNGEYTTYMRLAEVYLIRSEAKARNGDLSGALSDINVIRNRAGLLSLTLNTKADLLNANLHERQLELYYEAGDRFFDLKRFGLLDQTLSSLKPLWKSTARFFPIPQTEILNDPNLTQNQGY
jgi:hypothetical protein